MAVLSFLGSILFIFFLIAFVVPMTILLMSIIISTLKEFKFSKMFEVPRMMWDVALEELQNSIRSKKD